MLGWLKSRIATRTTGQQLYERIVAQAREPWLYEQCKVPDTMDGRLEMVLLHTVLVLDRLKTEGAGGQRLGQRLLEHLVAGTDDALRRIGIGDDGVAMRIKKLAGAIDERARDYGHAFGDAKLLAAQLTEHVYRTSMTDAPSHVSQSSRRLADYAMSARTALQTCRPADMLAGRPEFPDLGRAAVRCRGSNLEKPQ
jgi:cytochrome b pre-mRNA-processing protein 3